MSRIFAGVGKITLMVFTLAVIGLMAVMSYETLGRVYPDDPMKQVWGMVLFSGGTVAWFVIFLYASRSNQRPLALLLFILSLVGEVIYSAADVFMGGQSWVSVDPRMGEYVLWTFIGMTFAHGTALYVHFIVEPDQIASIEMETMQDKAEDEALRKAKELVEHHLDDMAQILAKRTMVNVMTGLSLPLPSNIIDGVARDVVPAKKAAEPPAAKRPEPTAPKSVFKLPQIKWPKFPAWEKNVASAPTGALVCLWCGNAIPSGVYCSDEHELDHLRAIEEANKERMQKLQVVVDAARALQSQGSANQPDFQFRDPAQEI